MRYVRSLFKIDMVMKNNEEKHLYDDYKEAKKLIYIF